MVLVMCTCPLGMVFVVQCLLRVVVKVKASALPPVS